MRIILVLAALLLANVALAQSNPSTDDINRLLAERGLVARIGDVGGKVEAKASELVINAMTFLGVPYKR
ncbi:MAG: peptidoglycan endopeptidase, partial [Rhodoferax sp.]